MKQETKLISALVVVAVLGAIVWFVRAEKAEQAEARAPGATQDLPIVKLTEDQAKKVDELVIENKDEGKVVLEKKGDGWQLTEPTSAKANQKAVDRAIGSLKKMELIAEIGEGEKLYDKYDLRPAKAVHVQALAGGEGVFDWYIGKHGSRGGKGGSNMVRRGGDGAPPTVYAAQGIGSHAFAKKPKDWREKKILEVEPANVVAVEVDNEHGKLSFTKEEGKWKHAYYPRTDGELASASETIDRFDLKKVKDLLRPIKKLNAADFAKEGAETGIDAPIDGGGAIVRVTMKDDTEPSHVIKIGNTQEGKKRYLAVEGDETVYVVTNWSVDMALGGPDKYQKPEEGEKAEGEGGEDAGPELPELPGKPGAAPELPGKPGAAPAPKPAPKPAAPKKAPPAPKKPAAPKPAPAKP